MNSTVPVVRLWLAVFAGYLALGATIQEIPAFVVRRFDGGPVLSGTAVGIAFLATGLCRPFAGAAADSGWARRVVILGGVCGAIGGIGHLLATDPAVLLISRLVMGAGEAALFSGALPWVLATAGPDKRGKVAGWFGLSMWGGLSCGPLLASALDALLGYRGVWWAVTALGFASAALTSSTPKQDRGPARFAWPRRLSDVVPRVVVLPGVVFGLSAYGYGTVSALAVLYLRHCGTGGQALALPLFAIAFLLTRFAGSPLVDRVGGVGVAIWSLAVEASGLILVGVVKSEQTVLIGAALAGAGVALMYPATVAITLRRTGTARPGVAVGAVTSFWDFGIMVAGPVGGVLAVTAGYPVAFVVAAVAGLTAAVVAVVWLRRSPPAEPTPDRTADLPAVEVR